MKKLERQDLIDILYGCTILGTGGGGSLQKGVELIDKALALSKDFVLVDFDELDDDDLIATPYSCGAISPETEEEKAKYQHLPISKEVPHVTALKEMEDYLGQDIKAVISTELGGGNTAVAFYTAAMSGKVIVDGDPAGRSVPELQHSTYYLNHLSITPMALCNIFGESLIVSNVVDDFRAETLVRALAVVSKNSMAVVDHIEKASVLKHAVINGAITHAWNIGKAFRLAKENNEDIVDAVVTIGKGKLLFEGTVTENQWDTVDGFTVGDVLFDGTGKNKGDTYRIWYKNENIMSWKNDAFFATVPDLICIFDKKNQEPVLNPYCDAGLDVAVFALPAPKEWTTQAGLDVFGPKSFGFDVDWTPIV